MASTLDIANKALGFVVKQHELLCNILRCVAMCCSMLQCVTVCCSVLQCVAACCRVHELLCNTFRIVAVCCSVVHYIFIALWCSVAQCGVVWCSALQYVAVCCSVLQCVAVCCSALQCVLVCCALTSLEYPQRSQRGIRSSESRCGWQCEYSQLGAFCSYYATRWANA